MTPDFELMFREILEVLHEGHYAVARRKIAAICRLKIPRQHLLALVQLMRHAYMHERIVAMLARLVRPGGREAVTAEPGEVAEYAFALGGLGAQREAFELLRSVSVRDYPESLFFQGVLHMRVSNFLGAEPFFRDFRKNTRGMSDLIDDCDVFLGSILIHGRGDYTGARTQLESVVARGAKARFDNIVGALVLLAQNEWMLGSVDRGFGYIERIWDDSRSLQEVENLRLNVQTWQRLLELKKYVRDEAQRKRAIRHLNEIHDRLQSSGLWTFARNIRMYRSFTLNDRTGLLRVYYGSSHEAVRRRVLQFLGEKAEDLAPEYRYRVGPASPVDACVDVRNGRNSEGRAHLKEGQLPQRLLEILASEFYVPRSVFEIHACLFPGDYFNPRTSIDRVHKVLARLRRWFTANRLPLRIEEISRRYRLVSDKGCTLVIRRPDAEPSDLPAMRLRDELALAKLRARYGHRPFNSIEGAAALKTSSKTITRLMNLATQSGHATREGKGPSTRYRLPPR